MQTYSRVCRNHTRHVKSHSSCGNCTLRVEIYLVRVEINLVRIEIVRIEIVRIGITFVLVDITLWVEITLCV
jgi:hypothetical protein